jgi:ribosomal protein S18 acetylase RimI-like enzyme
VIDVTIRPLAEPDLPAAERIFRLAFGTFLGLPDPLSFAGDTAYVATRWRTDPTAALAAEVDGALAGSNFAARWGSFGFFGPLSVRPDLWDAGVAQRLLARTMDLFAAAGTRHVGLFTFAQSPKHVGLYQKFGFWPRFLTAVMGRAVAARPRSGWSTVSEAPGSRRDACVDECGALADAVFAGLDPTPEIRTIAAQALGDTLLVRDEHGALDALALCHCGPGTEAGSGTCYVKFGAVRPGPDAPARFTRLLDACEELAAARGLVTLAAGVNLGREAAYRIMVERGFRTFLQGVAMQRPNEPAFNRPDAFVLDDWR